MKEVSSVFIWSSPGVQLNWNCSKTPPTKFFKITFIFTTHRGTIFTGNQNTWMSVRIIWSRIRNREHPHSVMVTRIKWEKCWGHLELYFNILGQWCLCYHSNFECEQKDWVWIPDKPASGVGYFKTVVKHCKLRNPIITDYEQQKMIYRYLVI